MINHNWLRFMEHMLNVVFHFKSMLRSLKKNHKTPISLSWKCFRSFPQLFIRTSPIASMCYVMCCAGVCSVAVTHVINTHLCGASTPPPPPPPPVSQSPSCLCPPLASVQETVIVCFPNCLCNVITLSRCQDGNAPFVLLVSEFMTT